MEQSASPSFVRAVLVAILAGLAAALLSGTLTPGSGGQYVMLFMAAPLPIMLAGLGWHPLSGALASLTGALLVDLVVNDRAALGFIGLVGAPAAGLAWLASLLLIPGRTRIAQHEGLALGWLYTGAMFYLSLAIIGTAIVVEPDYAAFTARLEAFVKEALELMLGVKGGVLPPGFTFDSFTRMVDLVTMLLLPVSALVSLISLVMSGALALAIARKSGLLPFPKPDLRRIRLPGGAILVLLVSMLLATREEFPGLFGLIVSLGLAFGFTLQGLAVMHVRSMGMSGRIPLLALGWSLLIVFGLPGVIFFALGLLDHLLDFRKNRLP
jgi:hypothetical protein